jgi:hypothetical protein
MMKARADDRRIFDAEVKLNVMAIQEAEKGHVSQADISDLLKLFENATTFGSLIQIPPKLAAKLPEIGKRLDDVLKFGDLTHASAHVLKPLLQQARLLARQYDAVVANPPYMGSKYYTTTLKEYVYREYKETKADLYACFMERNKHGTRPTGFHGMINIPNWMFLASFEELRKALFDSQTIDTFVHNGRGVFGSDFGSCAFVMRKSHLPDYRGSYRRLFEKQGSVASNEELEQRFHTATNHTPSNADFAKIPGIPVAYWVSEAFRRAFETLPTAEQFFFSDGLTKTGNNEKYLRFHWEVDCCNATDNSRYRFCVKGGPAVRYFGNNDTLVDWTRAAREHYRADYVARISPEYVWELSGVLFIEDGLKITRRLTLSSQP